MKKNNRAGLWVAGTVVLVAVIIGVMGLLWPRPGETPPAATDTTSQPSTPTGNGTCPNALPANTTSTVPADLRWEASQGVTWPVSDTVGPTATTDGFASCFQQSPIGAALFAMTTFSAVVDHPVADAARFYTAPSAELDEYLLGLSSSPSNAQGPAQQMKSAGITYAGYRVDSYSNDHATITLVLAVPGSATGYKGVPFDLVWRDSDWKIGKLSSGSSSTALIDVLDGQFVKWSN